jgi:AcrR family transcriptional regulator
MPRPRSLDQVTIATAALAVVDRHGLDALTMRAVAAELGMGTMSLYRYVSGREEVERLIVDRIFLAIDARVSANTSWQQQVTELSEAIQSAVRAHAAVIPLLLVHFQHSSGAWNWLAALLGALDRAGFTAPQRVIAVRTLQAYIIGALQSQFLNPIHGAGTNALARLSPGDYPLIAQTAQAALSATPDQEFRHGLAVVLEGLAVGLAKESTGRPGRMEQGP